MQPIVTKFYRNMKYFHSEENLWIEIFTHKTNVEKKNPEVVNWVRSRLYDEGVLGSLCYTLGTAITYL